MWVFQWISRLWLLIFLQYNDYREPFINVSINAKLSIKSKKNRIFAKKGIVKIPLVPIDEDTFYATQNGVVFYFNRNNAGEIKQFKVNASDFRNFIFEKSE